MSDLIGSLDRAVGDGLERLVCRHHRRRLRRIGWEGALNPGAGMPARAEPPARAGNRLEVLIDGEEALPAIASEIRAARSHVHIAGWHVASGFALTRDHPQAVVRELLAEVATRVPVRVLVWAGAPVPLFHPTRAEVRGARERLCRGNAIRCALDAHNRPMHCHHEKLVIVDDLVAFVGGIDLTDLAGDRFDRRTHPYRDSLGWHDVSARLHGPAVADVSTHFALRWEAITGERVARGPDVGDAGDSTVQVVRTVPEGTYPALPRGDFAILDAYQRALRGARRYIYLENQFLWSPEIVAVLRDRLEHHPDDDFRILVLLPARANNGADDTRGQLGVLVDADRGRGRFLACTLNSVGAAATRRVYVHAKVGIVDDTWLTLGSANLNDHSMFNDTEVNLVSCDPALARDTRVRLWSEHLGIPHAELGAPPARIIDEVWRPVAFEQRRRQEAGLAPTHALMRLPHVSKRSMRLLGPLQGLLVDG